MNSDSNEEGRHSRARRVLIISSIFHPHYAYLENVLASAFHRLGHEVRVITTEFDSKGARLNWQEEDSCEPYAIFRIGEVLRFRETYFPWGGAARRMIEDFDPELAIVLAANSGPGFFWTKCLAKECRLVAFFSDLPWHRGSVSSRIKKRWARKVMARANDVIAVTGQTAQLLKSWAAPEDQAKIRQKGLAFDPQSLEACPLPIELRSLRERSPRLIVCVTRVTPGKKLSEIFKAVEKCLSEHPDLGFVIAGLDEERESMRLIEQIKDSSVADRCVALPVLSLGEVGALFRVAAASIWSLVSIGIYHSLHCGCPVIVRRGQDAEHLLCHPEAGDWFESPSTLDQVLTEVIDRQTSREKVKAVASPYLAESVVEELIDEVGQTPRLMAS